MSSYLRSLPYAVALAAAVLVQGCATTMAPGAEKVRLTESPADVAGCTAVGNIVTPAGADGRANVSTPAKFQNQAIGLGGNTVLVTDHAFGQSQPINGVVYRCPGGN